MSTETIEETESTLFDLPETPVSHTAGEDLRMEIHRHLMAYPMLTAYEIARALHLDCPRGAGQNRVRYQLRLMEDDGEAEQVPGPRSVGDKRSAIRWIAT